MRERRVGVGSREREKKKEEKKKDTEVYLKGPPVAESRIIGTSK